MRRSRPFALVAALAVAAAGLVSPRSDAQDTPPAPPEVPPAPPADEPPVPPKAPDEPKAPEEPAPPAQPEGPQADPVPTDEEDAAARAFLAVAAERQGGKMLAAPDGKLESFHIVFHKVTLHRVVEKEGGGVSRQTIDSETPGLIVDWKGGQIRTEWRLMGETPVIRGVMLRKKRDGTFGDYPWLFDGTQTKSLLNAGYEKDLAEVERDRKIVKALLEVAVLRSMLTDGSRWKVVEDAAFPGTAIRRTPPASAATPLRLTLWFDAATHDVAAARLSPNEPGESTMYYGLEYHADFPKVKDGVLRFPFKFRVREQRIPEQEPMDVMTAMAGEASFNDLSDETFKAPAAKSPTDK